MQNRIIPMFTCPIIIILVLLFSLLIGFTKSSQAQEIWDLSKCVNYALENNIDLNLASNKVDNQRLNLLESKAQILPDLNMGTDLNFNFGRSIDGGSNAVTFNQTMSNNYWIESSVNIFQGLVKYNTIAYNNYLLAAIEEESVKVNNKLIFDVIQAYYAVLYSSGLERVAIEQVTLSYGQFSKMLKMVEVGKESPITAQELKSQWAGDKLKLTQAEALTQRSLLELKQLLRLDAKLGFEIDSININSLVINPIPAVDSLFSIALGQMPEIKREEFLLSASLKDLAVAKGKISPRLYLSAGYGSKFFDGDSSGFERQFKGNQNQYVNMGLVIPIFNQASTYSNIKRKQIAIKDQELQLELKKELLYTEIWNSLNDLLASEREFKSSSEFYEFSKLSFQNTKKKLEKGLSGPTDYELAKQRLASAEASLLKAKLIYIMRNEMLEFYKTGTWSHILG